VLDGVGGGLFEALLPLVLADIMGGTGHYSLARGLVGTVQGIGGSSSQAVAGYIVTTAGYNAVPNPCDGGHGWTASHSHRHARDNAVTKRRPLLTVKAGIWDQT
jgi:hypothetical protein